MKDARILNLYMNGSAVECLYAAQQGVVVLDRTPFYAESGGQAGDRGVLLGEDTVFEVSGTVKYGGRMHGHIGVLNRGELRVGDSVTAQVDTTKRQATALNHSATHLLHAALRRVLGDHVTQKGSLVDDQRLRFDFSHFEPLTATQLEEIERLVNAQIRVNADVETRIMAIDEAMQSGAQALFGEKYDALVRVLRMGEFSTELCGGTHVRRLGDIGLFKIVTEGGIASGVRRIEAVTGEQALEYVNNMQSHLQQVAQLVKADSENAEDKVRQLVDKARRLEREVEQLKAKFASSQGDDLVNQAIEVDGVKVLAACLEDADPKALRDAVDQIKSKLKAAAVVLATVEDGKVRLVAGVTPDQTSRLKAGELVNMVAQQVGGKGGGRADLAQAGGTDPSRLEAALRSVPAWVRSQLS